VNSDISEEKTQIKKIKRLKKNKKTQQNFLILVTNALITKKTQQNFLILVNNALITKKNTTKFPNFGHQRSYIAHTQQRRTGHTGGI
jgi:hypothetical protein